MNSIFPTTKVGFFPFESNGSILEGVSMIFTSDLMADRLRNICSIPAVPIDSIYVQLGERVTDREREIEKRDREQARERGRKTGTITERMRKMDKEGSIVV